MPEYFFFYWIWPQFKKIGTWYFDDFFNFQASLSSSWGEVWETIYAKFKIDDGLV